MCPLFCLLLISIGSSDGLWLHLYETVLAKYVLNTVSLMVGVGFFTFLIGVTTAWIVTTYNFHLKKFCDFVLLLPAACPAYLIAYAYTDFLEYAGPLQGFLRQITGWTSSADYYFPEIRSLGGTIFVLSSVLYPYVYILSRTAFRQTPSSLLDVSKIYGKSTFWYLSLPLARPAIIVGLALVSMEVISDFGTVEYFSLQTLTLGIFNVWIGMNNITAAAQIAVFTFIFIIGLLILELKFRANKRFNNTTNRSVFIQPKRVNLRFSAFLVTLCLLPVMFGFIIPVSILLSNIIGNFSFYKILELWIVLKNTVFIAFIGSLLIILIATFIVCATATNRLKFLPVIAHLSATGYAFPGTMLAIGVLVTVGFIDEIIELSTSINLYSEAPYYLSGTILVLLFAYVVRFNAVGYGSILSGISKTPPNLISVSKTLGASPSSTINIILIPLLKKSIVAGGLLAFVDIMKELPMTLLLRPFNFETLATYTYQYANYELMDEASFPALLIILVGLIPIMFLNKYLRS